MARTYRRKGFEATMNSSWDTEGFKVAGHYTTYDGSYWKSNGSRWMKEYRPMNKRERFNRWYWMHGESRTRSMRSPNRWHRNIRQRENRMINKMELIKWIKAGGEYEPMFEENARDCWWDWS